MSDRSVVRGGRIAELAAKKAAEDAERQKLQAEQMEADLRHLCTIPHFRRVAVQWIRQSGVFNVPVGLPGDQMREWTGRAAFGAMLWNSVTAVDPTFAVEVLAQPSTPPKNE